jgi:predicted acyltransferase (DUF342 family)
MIKTKKIKINKPLIFDRNRNVLLIRKNSVIDKRISFKGKVIVGIDACLWGDVECEEILVGKASYIKGKVICRKAIVGAKTEFNSIVGEEISIQNGCKGRYVRGKTVVIRKNVEIESLEAETAYIDGISKLGKIDVKKVVASKSP